MVSIIQMLISYLLLKIISFCEDSAGEAIILYTIPNHFLKKEGEEKKKKRPFVSGSVNNLGSISW